MKKRMKQKILIGSIFVALLMVSMPFVSTLQAAPAPLDECNIVEFNIVESEEMTSGFVAVHTQIQVDGTYISVGHVHLWLTKDGSMIGTGRTNAYGNYVFTGLDTTPGIYRVIASKYGYKTQTTIVRLGYNTIIVEKGEYSYDDIAVYSLICSPALVSLLHLNR